MNAVHPRNGDAMNKIPWAGTVFTPSITKQYMLSVHTVVLKGIAVFFCSTYSLPITDNPPICTTFFKTSAPALRRVRFFVTVDEEKAKKVFIAHKSGQQRCGEIYQATEKF